MTSINKNLQMLLPDIELGDAAKIEVNQLTLDSRKVNSGGLFIAIKGQKLDGKEFISQAIAQGATAVLVEVSKRSQKIEWMNQVPVIAIENLPEKISLIASRFYDQPDQGLSLIAVTGTNGKTTCSLLAAQLLARTQKSHSGVIGTLGYGVLNDKNASSIAQQIQLLSSTGLTTPDAISLQSILHDMKKSDVGFVAMEVSSHSLHQHRVAALQFHTAIFTNLTQDHLDYHGDMQTYGKVKAGLLQFPGLQYAIINSDDAWANSLYDQAPVSVKVIRYSLQKDNTEVYAQNIQLDAQGVTADLVSPWGNTQIRSPLIGLFNLSNLIAVIAAVCAQGIALDKVAAQLSELMAAPGRMQSVVVDQQQDINVIVDYAHTPDALETTLKAIKQHQQRVWTVFGCGGDRDKTKRPLMGRIAEIYSDYVLITNDNPRSEDPALIAADIIRGMKNPHACLTIADRSQAIDMAIQQAKPADLVLIAGKGHENYQIFAQQTVPFSDEQQARLALQRRLVKQQSMNSITGAQS